MTPKVLIGAPIFDGNAYATPEYLKGIQSLTCANKEYLLVDNSQTDAFFKNLKKKNISVIRDFFTIADPRERLVAGRNLLAQKVIEGKYDYFLSLEQDVIPPKDVIEKLSSHQKQIISGVYYNYYKNARGERVAMPVLYRNLTEKERQGILQNKERFSKVNPATYQILQECNFDFSAVQRQLTRKEVAEKKLMQVKACGLGCVLVHRSVLEQVKFRANKLLAFDDVVFCEDARRKGIEIYADTSVICKHLIKNKPWKWVQFK